MFDNEETLIKYKVINIITGEDFVFDDDYLYPDDTNNMIINKIINYCYPKTILTPNEIYAYSNNESLCFEYENIGEMNHIIKDNKLTQLLPDTDFVNNLGIQKIVKSINKYNKLFESNNLEDKTIYYFSLYELFDKLGINLNTKPNITHAIFAHIKNIPNFIISDILIVVSLNNIFCIYFPIPITLIIIIISIIIIIIIIIIIKL